MTTIYENLTAMAEQAETQARHYQEMLNERPLMDVFERRLVSEKVAYYLGQASGFGQAAYFARQGVL